LLDLLAVELLRQIFERLGLEDALVRRQNAHQRLELTLHGGHRVGDERRQVGAAYDGLRE